MSQQSTRVWTGSLAGSVLTIVMADQVTAISLQITAGSITIQGNGTFNNSSAGTGSLSPTPIVMPTGATYTLQASGAQAPIDGFVIDATGGTVIITLIF